MRTKKFNQEAAKRRWLKQIKADPYIMDRVTQIAAICQNIAQLKDRLRGLAREIDQSELVFLNELSFGKPSLDISSYTINDEYWWQYGDNSDQYGPPEQVKNLALYASIKEADGMRA